MLTIEHLNCGYGKHEILHDISVTIPDKKITAIVGQSGCGKTTLLNAIGGLDKTSGGSIEVFGESISGGSDNTDAVSNLFRKKL